MWLPPASCSTATRPVSRACSGMARASIFALRSGPAGADTFARGITLPAALSSPGSSLSTSFLPRSTTSVVSGSVLSAGPGASATSVSAGASFEPASKRMSSSVAFTSVASLLFRNAPGDEEVVVVARVRVAEPERQRLRLLGPQLAKHLGVSNAAPQERTDEAAVGELLEAVGDGVVGGDAGAVGDHPHHVLQQVVADLGELLPPQQVAGRLGDRRDLTLRLKVAQHARIGLQVRVVQVRGDH